MTTEAEEVLYGGAAGGGKSYGLRAWGVNYSLVNPGATVVLFRETFPQLEETHLQKIQTEVPSSIAHYHGGRHDLIFNNGSVFMFRVCEKDEDARKHDSAEYDAMLFDELTAFSQFQYVYLTSRCRSVRPGWTGPRFRSGATPLGPGHSWVHERWVAKHDPFDIWKAPVSEGGLTRQFIPAKLSDNPALTKAHPEYINQLKTLPYEEYRAKALGDWEIFEGQFFSRWRDNVHVCQPFDIPPDWERFICVDYGFNAPYCVLWFARPPETDVAYVYREHYGKGVTLEEQVRLTKMAVVDNSEKIRAVILDPAMFSKVNVKGERIDSMAEDWRSEFPLVIKGNNERIPGWRLMRQMIDWTEGPSGDMLTLPRLRIFSTCFNTVRTVPKLRVNDHMLEDVDSNGEDHAADALRYGLVHAFQGGGKSGNQRTYHLTPRGIAIRSR